MTAWWEALTALQKFFALLAVPATLLLLLQTALLLIGLGGHGEIDTTTDTDGDGIPDYLEAPGHIDHFDVGGQTDLDYCAAEGHDHAAFHDHSGDGVPDHSLRVFSLRTAVAFFAIFGWTGIVLTKGGLGEGLSAVLAFCSGGLAMFLLAWLLKLALDLQSEGNLDPRNAVGREGTVYLTIPPGKRGAGKVTVLVQGRLAELVAVTECPDPIPTGAAVLVRAASADFLITVEPIIKSELGGTQIEA